MSNHKKNIFGEPLQPCCLNIKTGYFRDGYCRTDQSDRGRHVVCAEMTESFLVFTRDRGNDLFTPRPEFGFPGLKPGDRWCLCALRWKEAWQENLAPPVIPESCEESALEIVSLKALLDHALGAVH
jgi:uncharacterized protein (DUF2237 family)